VILSMAGGDFTTLLHGRMGHCLRVSRHLFVSLYGHLTEKQSLQS
jgi:hypothetical protein